MRKQCAPKKSALKTHAPNMRNHEFCKMQSFTTKSRSTSKGPKAFLSGRVMIGVGLARNQFGMEGLPAWNSLTEGASACGINLMKCIFSYTMYIDI